MQSPHFEHKTLMKNTFDLTYKLGWTDCAITTDIETQQHSYVDHIHASYRFLAN